VKVAVLSDVHANLEALTAVLEDVEKRSVDRVLFLGDAVGYGADPGPCLEALEKFAFRIVAGNHDHAAGKEQGAGLDDLHEDAAAAIRWTQRVLPQEAKSRLRALPLDCLDDGTYLVHGSPHKPDRWEYVMSIQDAEKGFGSCEKRVIFVGHTHIPAVYVELECRRLFTGVMRRIEQAEPAAIKIEQRYRYILNVGSVGQPRDGDPRACYGTYDDEAGSYTLHRIPYDVDRASRKIRKAGLPEALAERLASGD
jgi:diadenosine tetraphosphatase ApaH/serine/threonine PP2A family protein phosphatase